ncbi:hypothetical protein CPC08DRAFT_819964 [Agrocybe pediades]|nr:hypothetical protein CPC08DRAFT_819964 [Agrocybe pediades]
MPWKRHVKSYIQPNADCSHDSPGQSFSGVHNEVRERVTNSYSSYLFASMSLSSVALSFSSLYGANLVAVIVSSWIYGVGLFMSLNYFKTSYGKDASILQAMVLTLCILSTLGIVFSAHQIYFLLITCHNKPEMLKTMPFSVLGQYTCVYLIKFIGQTFFASRIWSSARTFNTRLAFIAIPVVLLSVIQLGTGIVQVVTTGHRQSFAKMSPASQAILLKATTSIQSGSSALCDIIISVTLCWIFHSHRSTLKRTNSLISKLIFYAINRAIATSLCALLTVFLFRKFYGTYYFKIPFLASAQVYVISVVSVLASRKSMRQEHDDTINLSVFMRDNLASTQKSDTAGPDGSGTITIEAA